MLHVVCGPFGKGLDLTTDDIQRNFDNRGFGDPDPSVKCCRGACWNLPAEPPPYWSPKQVLGIVLGREWAPEPFLALPFLVIIFIINYSAQDSGESRPFSSISPCIIFQIF